MQESAVASATLKIVRVGVLSGISKLDPREAVDNISGMVLGQIFETPYGIAAGETQVQPQLFEPLRAEVRRRAFKPAVDACRIVPGLLPLSAGVVGAIATFKMKTLGDL